MLTFVAGWKAGTPVKFAGCARCSAAGEPQQRRGKLLLVAATGPEVRRLCAVSPDPGGPFPRGAADGEPDNPARNTLLSRQSTKRGRQKHGIVQSRLSFQLASLDLAPNPEALTWPPKHIARIETPSDSTDYLVIHPHFQNGPTSDWNAPLTRLRISQAGVAAQAR